VLSFEFCDLSHLRLIGLATLFSPFYLLPVSRELRSYYHYRTIKSWMAICHAINFSKKSHAITIKTPWNRGSEGALC
jgi:hypothetical protein